MRFHSALSDADNLRDACVQVADDVRRALEVETVDLLVAFASPALGELRELPRHLLTALPATHLVGCSGAGVLASGREVEDDPAVAVLAGIAPGVDAEVRHVQSGDLPDPDAPPAAWTDLFGLTAREARGFLVIPDPYSCPVSRLLDGLDYAYPNAPKVGGLASGGGGPGRNVLFANDLPVDGGAVVLGLKGRVQVDSVVAQGCKPIGTTGTVTQCDGHELLAVDGKPALSFLQEQLDALDTEDLHLARRSPLFLGVSVSAFADHAPEPGAFLIRQILGLDKQSGALAIGGSPRLGRKVRFHLRDRQTSADDLERLLSSVDARPAAALMFSCLGRGQHLYGQPDHDSTTFRHVLGDQPLVGFFCNGEIGPVGDATFLHGFTSSFALLREGRG